MTFYLNLEQIQDGSRVERSGFAVLLVILTACAVIGFTSLATAQLDWLGAGRYQTAPIPPGPHAVPMSSSPLSSQLSNVPSHLGHAIVQAWAGQDLQDWSSASKSSAPRIVLAKLATRQHIEAVNRHLQAAKPVNAPGSTWLFHKGDYDFREVTLTAILYLFGDRPDVLYPKTLGHLLDVLLLEEGGTPHPMVPRSFGLVLDTENHHLMREGSRYLKNQWLFERGPEQKRGDPAYDNVANGLEQWLIDYLQEMIDEGVYEFNSQPYLKYTVQALLNLDAFARSEKVARRARHILDTMNWQYALGSLDLRRFAPFRRRTENAKRTRLDRDSHTSLMRIWVSPPYDSRAPKPEGNFGGRTGLVAGLLPYRLPDAVKQWTLNKPHDYFVRFGRGTKASPEIYSGGPGYLLSAGGVNRGMRSLIVARPITLMLSDGAKDLGECFHIRGKGTFRHWNNTGVHRLFACCKAPVHIPQRYTPAAAAGNWRVFAPGAVKGLRVVTYGAERLGLIVLFPNSPDPPGRLLEAVRNANSSEQAVRNSFVWPDGKSIAYDVGAPKGTWVIAAVDREPVNRDYDAWPQFTGDAPRITSDRTVAGKP